MTVGSVSRAFDRFRPAYTAHLPTSGASVKNGNLTISGFSLSSSDVKPEQSITVTVTVKNSANFINPLDGASCTVEGPLSKYGYKYRIEINPQWESNSSREGCLTIAQGTVTHTFEITAPSSPGRYTLGAFITALGSGESAGTPVAEITVSEPANGGGGDGGGGDGGGGGGGGSGGGEQPGQTPGCPPGQVRVPGRGCVPLNGSPPGGQPPSTRRCSSSADCGQGSICLAGRCVNRRSAFAAGGIGLLSLVVLLVSGA